MNETFPTSSTYIAPFTILDREQNPVDLSSATVRYAVSRLRGGSDVLYEIGDDNSELEIHPDGNTGVVEITIPASDLTWTGRVFEELRVDVVLSGSEQISTVTTQRRVEFVSTTTK